METPHIASAVLVLAFAAILVVVGRQFIEHQGMKRPGAPAGHGEITLGLQPIYPAFLIASPVAASMPCFASRSRGARQSVIPGAGRVARPISAAGIHH